MLNTATPRWLLAAGLVGLIAAPASAQSDSRAAIVLSPTEAAALYDGSPLVSQAALPYDGPVASPSVFRFADCEADQQIVQDAATAAYSQGNTANNGSPQELGQSFVAPCDGELSSFQFIYQPRMGGAGLEADFSFTVYGGAGTATAPLATVTRTITTEPEGSAYALLFELDEPVPVAEGSEYTVFLDNTNDTNINIQGANTNPYADGAAYASSSGTPEGAGPAGDIDLRFTATFQPGEDIGPPLDLVVADSSFEEGVPNPFWFTNTPGYLGGSPIFGTPRNPDFDFARTGVWYVILGSGGPAESDVYQDIEVPAAGTDSLRFWLFAGINEGSESVLNVYIDDELLDTIDADEAAEYGTYTELAYEYMFEEAGTYRIRFQQTQPVAGADFINWFIDDVTFGEGAPPPPPTPGVELITQETDIVSFGVYADGDLGTDSEANNFPGPGFTFNGTQGLFSSTFLAGTGPTMLVGSSYDASEWVTERGLVEIEAPVGFTTAYEAVYTDANAASPLGLRITQRTYSDSLAQDVNAGVVAEFVIENTTESDIANLYTGIFADWDVGDAAANFADFYQGDRIALNHVWDPIGTSPWYGVALLNRPASGYGFDQEGAPADGDSWTGLTEFAVTPDTPGDRRTTTGAGPYDIAAGGSVTVKFAYVGGVDQADLIENAEAIALRVFATASEEPAELELAKTGLRVFPNPVAGQATVAFRAPAGADASVAVYDVLGREVLRVADQMATDAEQRVQLDTSSLPAGLYLVRLTAGGTSAVQQITVVR